MHFLSMFIVLKLHFLLCFFFLTNKYGTRFSYAFYNHYNIHFFCQSEDYFLLKEQRIRKIIVIFFLMRKVSVNHTFETSHNSFISDYIVYELY